MAAFALRRPKLIIADKGTSPDNKLIKIIEAESTQGVLVEKAENLRLQSKQKLANLSIVDCCNLMVDIPGSVSAVDILRSKDIQVSCKAFATTFSIEKCQRITVKFPEDSKDVKIITIASPGTHVSSMIRMNDEEAKVDTPAVQSISLDIKLHELGLAGEEGTPQIEILCKWDSLAKMFEVQALKRDARNVPLL
jgi:hypothetical protein